MRITPKSSFGDSGQEHARDEGWLGAERRFTVTSMEASLAMVSAGLAFGWLPEHLILPAITAGRARALPLAAGAMRNVSLYVVLVRPELAGPAAREAVQSFTRHLPITPATLSLSGTPPTLRG